MATDSAELKEKLVIKTSPISGNVFEGTIHIQTMMRTNMYLTQHFCLILKLLISILSY